VGEVENMAGGIFSPLGVFMGPIDRRSGKKNHVELIGKGKEST